MSKVLGVSLQLIDGSIFFSIKNLTHGDIALSTHGFPLENPRGPQLIFTGPNGVAKYQGIEAERVSPLTSIVSWREIPPGKTITKVADISCYALVAGDTYIVSLDKDRLLYTTTFRKGVKGPFLLDSHMELIECNMISFTMQ